MYFSKKKKNYFPTKKNKKSFVIGETKTKFFATTLNWYKYNILLRVVYIILNEMTKKKIEHLILGVL